uniref:Dynein light chain n=4 Tax=Cyprinidae TaxID=7953 RepID=A0A8C1XV59_CYPCA
MSKYHGITDTTVSKAIQLISILDLLDQISDILNLSVFPHLELNIMAETADGKKDEADYKRLHSFPLIRHTDMPEEMRVETMELCVTACEKFATNNESAAKMIKESMDKKFGSSWHVVIGEGFGFEITHEVKNLLYMFFGGGLAVCVWKCS